MFVFRDGCWLSGVLLSRLAGTDGDPTVPSSGRSCSALCPAVCLSVRPCCSKDCPHNLSLFLYTWICFGYRTSNLLVHVTIYPTLKVDGDHIIGLLRRSCCDWSAHSWPEGLCMSLLRRNLSTWSPPFLCVSTWRCEGCSLPNHWSAVSFWHSLLGVDGASSRG